VKEVRTEIDINAPPAAVWREIVDFPGRGEWDPLVPLVVGEADPGARLKIRVELPEAKPVHFTPVIEVFRPEEELCWTTEGPLALFFKGAHYYRLEPLDGGTRTRFVHGETYRGPVPALFTKTMWARIEAGFEATCNALKARVEARL
jgi:hypothetical protein